MWPAALGEVTADGPVVQIVNPRHSLLHALQRSHGTAGTHSQEWLQLAGSVAARALGWVVHLPP